MGCENLRQKARRHAHVRIRNGLDVDRRQPTDDEIQDLLEGISRNAVPKFGLVKLSAMRLDDGVEPPALFARTAEESAERGLPLRPLNPDYWWEHPDYRPVYHGNEDYRAPDPPPRRAVFGDGDGAEDADIARE